MAVLNISFLGGKIIMSQTEQANCAFYLQVKQIQGVEVEVVGGEAWNEKTIVVTVPDLFSAVADEVIDLKTRLHQAYPTARLNIEIIETAANPCERNTTCELASL